MDYDELDEEEKGEVKESLCSWITMQYYEETKKYDVETDTIFNITKTFDFACNVLTSKSVEETI